MTTSTTNGLTLVGDAEANLEEQLRLLADLETLMEATP